MSTSNLYVRPPMAQGQGFAIHADKRNVIATCKDESLAHLFAASPDILAALESVIAFIESVPMQGDFERAFNARYPWTQVQAALAKAKGQS